MRTWTSLLGLLLCLPFLVDAAAEPTEQHPLQAADTSSPRSTVAGFLEVMDRYGEAALAYRENPSSETFSGMEQEGRIALRYLDLINIAETRRVRGGEGKAVLLWEALSRIDLPRSSEIPDEEEM